MRNFFLGWLRFILLYFFSLPLCYTLEDLRPKVLICGVCKDVEVAVSHTINNIEELGSHLSDYAVIIYENNSKDRTAALFSEWAQKNPRIAFISENLSETDLPTCSTERIARARNIVLKIAREEKYKGFPYLIMVDLDFCAPWPIEEIVKTIHLPIDWDCISANGVRSDMIYYDRYAFRNASFPFGPELIFDFWPKLWNNEDAFKLMGEELVPVYSAFGGLAIYKTASILNHDYSGVPTSDLETFYKQIVITLPRTNSQLKSYLRFNRLQLNIALNEVPIEFRIDPLFHEYQCCEHLPLHASMTINGCGKFYINPKMVMYY